MRHFDQTLEFIDRIQQARTSETVCRALLSATERHGLTALLAGTVPDPGTPGEEQKSHVLLCDWPVAWLERYIACNYIDYDPLVGCVRRTPEPTMWHAAAEMAPVDSMGRRVFGDAGEFALNDGIAFPLVTLEGVVVMVSLGGEAVELSPEDFGAVSLVSAYAIGRAMQLCAAEDVIDHRPGLTVREIECIRWAAVGKSEWEISQILGISEHTSEKHLLNAKAKLGAVNRVHAVAEAIRCGHVT